MVSRKPTEEKGVGMSGGGGRQFNSRDTRKPNKEGHDSSKHLETTDADKTLQEIN